MRIGLLGTLAVHDEAGRPVRVGGYRVRMLLILLALDAGRVVPVQVSKVERKDFPIWLEGLGTVAAFQQVAVRAQVDGKLDVSSSPRASRSRRAT